MARQSKGERQPASGIDIVALAFELARAVEIFAEHARRFFYEVALSGYACPRCGGRLQMLREGQCRCIECQRSFDPTLTFQRCGTCGGGLQLRICRYQCRHCGQDVTSRFLFDGLVFDREYFRQHMAESRQRQTERRQEWAEQTAINRSPPLENEPADLQSIPGLVEALNALSGGMDVAALLPLCKGLDLNRYQKHLLMHLGAEPASFDDLPPLEEDRRLDRIWRFVTMIFMAHAGLISIDQEGPIITLTVKHR